MKQKITEKIRGFKPPLIKTGVAAILFSTLSILEVSTDILSAFPNILVYLIYIGAAVSLTLAVWSLAIFFSQSDWKRRITEYLHKRPFIGKLMDDFDYRVLTITHFSFVINVFFSVSKGIAGWFASSAWLITLAAYYLLLCISKVLLLRASRKIGKIENKQEQNIRQWRAYRLCGTILLFMTIVLQGVVVLLMKTKNQFTYNEILILAVAAYDFYCLISSIVYMAKNRKKHTPIIVAIKSVSFATSLVSMLSLQSAMFASYGGRGDVAKQNIMNMATGSAVSVTLLGLGGIMIWRATKAIKKIRK